MIDMKAAPSAYEWEQTVRELIAKLRAEGPRPRWISSTPSSKKEG
jgi:hypothetical protein